MADVKLTLIPIIFIVLRIWSTVRFILLLVDSPVRQNPVLVTLHVSLKNRKKKICDICRFYDGMVQFKGFLLGES